VIESELAQVRLHILGRAEAVHDPGESVEKPVALGVPIAAGNIGRSFGFSANRRP